MPTASHLVRFRKSMKFIGGLEGARIPVWMTISPPRLDAVVFLGPLSMGVWSCRNSNIALFLFSPHKIPALSLRLALFEMGWFTRQLNWEMQQYYWCTSKFEACLWLLKNKWFWFLKLSQYKTQDFLFLTGNEKAVMVNIWREFYRAGWMAFNGQR